VGPCELPQLDLLGMQIGDGVVTVGEATGGNEALLEFVSG
jgi:hypothetical protein